MELNGTHQLFGYAYYSKYLLLYFVFNHTGLVWNKLKVSNDDIIFIFG